MKYTKINSETIDRWVEEGWTWGIPITKEAYKEASQGNWEMLLTPTIPVPKSWFPNLKDKKVLGLASGGAQQMPIFASQGAICTVLDYSKKQLDSEIEVSKREGYTIETLQKDMTETLPFEDNTFDIIFHPVSNSYVEDVSHIWRECYRILKPGGILMSGLDNGINYIFDDSETYLKYSLPFNPLKDKKRMDDLLKEDSGVQFSHTLEDQLRGQLLAGLQFVDMYEDTNGEGKLHEMNIPTFWATLAKK